MCPHQILKCIVTTPPHLCRYCPLWGLIPLMVLFSPEEHSSEGKGICTFKRRSFLINTGIRVLTCGAHTFGQGMALIPSGNDPTSPMQILSTLGSHTPHGFILPQSTQQWGKRPLHIEGRSFLINTFSCASLDDVGFHGMQDPPFGSLHALCMKTESIQFFLYSCIFAPPQGGGWNYKRVS